MSLDQRVPRLELDRATATIWFDRSDKRNALNLTSWSALPSLIQKAVAHRSVRVILIRGDGGHFAAGADIEEFDAVFADRQTTFSYLDAMQTATAAIEAAPLPIIAVVEGLCIGAGVAIASACDLRIGSSDARFAITPAKLGLVYSRTDTRRVIDLIGASATKDLLFTGRMIDADIALSLGLVNEVHDKDALAHAVLEKVKQISGNSAWSHMRSKAIVASVIDGARGDDEHTRAWFADAPQNADYLEGVAAFRARRRPAFAER